MLKIMQMGKLPLNLEGTIHCFPCTYIRFLAVVNLIQSLTLAFPSFFFAFPPTVPTVVLSRETSPAEDGVPTAEEATEATESNAGVGEEEDESQGSDQNQPGIYTEHVFTDPLGVGPTDPSATDTQR